MYLARDSRRASGRMGASPSGRQAAAVARALRRVAGLGDSAAGGKGVRCRLMAYHDLDEARGYHAALKTIILRHPGDSADLRAMQRLVDLSRRAAEAVNDGYCREKMRLVAEYGAELLAHAEHARWRRPSISGEQFLKQQALNALELFQSRLYSIEAMRNAAARHALAGFQLSPR